MSKHRHWSPDAQPFYVEKGTVVHSTYPGWPADGKPAGRGYAVLAVTDPDGQQTWPGSGGYWRWVKPTTKDAA
jgi:hypothetical protein